MIGTILAAWLLPVLIGTAFGMWTAQRPANTPGEFVKDVCTAILFAGCAIFMLQMILIGALMTGFQGGISGLGAEAWRWTFFTGLFWVPGLVIAYIVKAMRIRERNR